MAGNSQTSDLNLTERIRRWKSHLYNGWIVLADDNNSDVDISLVRVPAFTNSLTRLYADDIQEQLENEILKWRRLQSKHMVPLLGYVVDDIGLLCLVSPLYQQGNLADYLHSNTNANRHSLVSDITEGLKYLHSIPIVHGDLQAETVKVDNRGSAILYCFAMQLVSDGNQTSTLNAKAGYRYSSPELLKNKPKTLQSDIWAFACLVMQTFTRNIPYHKAAPLPVIPYLIWSGNPPYKTIGVISDPTLRAFVKKCWKLNPQKRPSIDDLSHRPRRETTFSEEQSSSGTFGAGLCSSLLAKLGNLVLTANVKPIDKSSARETSEEGTVTNGSKEQSSVCYNDVLKRTELEETLMNDPQDDPSEEITFEDTTDDTDDETTGDESEDEFVSVDRIPELEIKTARRLATSVPIFRRTSKQVVDLLENRWHCLTTWEKANEKNLSLAISRGSTLGQELLFDLFRNERECHKNRLTHRARLINGLLSALSEAGFRVDIWLNDIALVLIMIWIVLSEPDRYTKDSLLAPDHLFLGSLDEDALELVKSINPSSAVGTTFSSQVKTNSAVRFGKVYWLVRAAFLLIVDPLASSKMHKSLIDCISPSQLLQAAVGHAPWLEGAAMTIKKIEDAESNIGRLVILKQEKIDVTCEKLGTPEHDRDVPPQVRYQRPLLNPASAQQLVNPKSEKHSEIGRSPISGSLQSSQRYMRYRYL